MKKHLIVISFDAVSSKDLEILKNYPNFKYIMSNGAVIKNVDSVYPSLTYPAHTTIVTGKYPCNHGVINNTKLEINEPKPDWYWYRKNIKGKTLYDVFSENGLSTAGIFWPVSARSSIKYNMPEIFPTKKWHNQMIMSGTGGNLLFQLDINKKFSHIRRGISEPELDDFSTEAMKHTIKKYKPNLVLLHLIDTDTHRHYTGYGSKESNESLKRQDRRLGEIIQSLKDAEIFDDSIIVALGDHSQLDGDKIIKLNVLLEKNGLIDLDSDGKIKNYRAIAKSCDGSAYIYLKDKNDTKSKLKIKELLEELKKDEKQPIDFILDSNEARSYGADGECSFMVEANVGYYFINEIQGDVIENMKSEDVGKKSHRTFATHGYCPSKLDYGTFFIACGPGIKKGVTVEKGSLINHAPTMAAMFGFKMDGIDGNVIKEILNEN
ncbi:MAG: ectonucleotide pyrophosphatase/phosphodiesterase [Clostridium sp.]